MIVPSIDLSNGQAVQLVGGREPRIEAGDPRPIAERFRLAGEIAVIDLDAARGTGNNRALIEELVRMAPCRVGGGIRDVNTARHWLDAGARRIILGTAATPEILSQLPRQRVIVALDALHDEVVTHGWTTRSGETVDAGMARLHDLAGGFLVTFVEREGRMEGTDLDRALALSKAAGDARLTVAGGFTDPREIATADRAGIDAQVGMALYSGALHLADAIAAPLVSDRQDGLWPTVVVDEHQRALGLAWSDAESLRVAVDRKAGVYHSRTRGLWIKGETSGATQELLRIDPDCDRDALKFTVRQAGGGFCHLGTRTCWGNDTGLPALVRVLAGRLADAPAGSYTARLFSEPAVLEAKLLEEAAELAAAGTRAEVVHEAADVIFFALIAAVRAGVDLADIEGELDRRALAVTRRSAT
ncbi:MAG: phosphoribosyl-ATP diphosphatase [bacterium]|nr:phosphoribosyl-ATP diphosphatase [bacterium]MDE0239325.1 phosphoribosyl-ATP diphosphatase [bacterium]MDE0419240.1 phosphoribosyl-ATP diphosphatase [bacterium]